MKKYLLMFVMSAFTTLSIAEPVSKSLSTDVLDVSVMPGSAVADVSLSDGRVLNIEQNELTMYLSVVPNVKFSYDSPLFLYNEKDEIVSLNPKTFNKGNGPAQQEEQPQQLPTPTTAPLQAGTQGNVINVRSLDNNLVINKITINRGNCTTIDLKAKRDYINAEAEKNPNVKTGSRWHFEHATGVMVFGKEDHWQTDANCSIIEAVLDTNLGSWTVHGT